MRRAADGRIRDRLADRLKGFRPVKQIKRRVATKVVTWFAAAVIVIGVLAGVVAALLGG